MIELRGLHRYFGATKAVKEVSFSVEAGQVFGYIGPNGAGKTTSMRILATLDVPTAGDAFVDGFSVVDDPDRVRQRLGFMPDYFGVYSNMSVWEYLDFFARSYALVGKEKQIAISRVMEFTGLWQLAQKPIDGLSKGMKQRLCLGRALIHDPPVLILDEPAAGLDPRARIELREMIRNLAAEGKTILISSHILTELAEMCDRVGIIEQGELVTTGLVEEIRKQAQPHSRIVVVVLSRASEVALWLEERGGLSDIKQDGDQLAFTHTGDRADEAVLLRELVVAGFEVSEFRVHEKSLEDIFLHVTQGRIQ